MYNTAFGSFSKLKAACVNGIKICHNMQASSDELVQAAPVVPALAARIRTPRPAECLAAAAWVLIRATICQNMISR